MKNREPTYICGTSDADLPLSVDWLSRAHFLVYLSHLVLTTAELLLWDYVTNVLAHPLPESHDELQEWILQMLPWLYCVKIPFRTLLKLERIGQNV